MQREGRARHYHRQGEREDRNCIFPLEQEESLITCECVMTAGLLLAPTHTFTFRWVDGFGSARAAVCHRVNEDISTVKELICDVNVLWP